MALLFALWHTWETLRNNEKGPKKSVICTDKTWVHTLDKTEVLTAYIAPSVVVNKSEGQKAIVPHAGEGWGS
jgi:hypothetical protein